MLLLVVVSIIARMFGKPISGSYDYVGFILALTVSLSLAHCAFKKGHTQVDMFVNRLFSRTAAVVDSCTGLLSLAFFSVVTWQCLSLAGDIRRAGEVSMTALAVFYPYIYGMAFGCGLLTLAIFFELLGSIGKAVKG